MAEKIIQGGLEKFPNHFLAKKKFYLAVLGVAVIILIFQAFVSVSAVSDEFPVNSVVLIRTGETLRNVADNLEKDGIVHSSFWLKLYISLTSGEHTVQAGEYKFGEPISLREVAERITTGEYGFPVVTVTIPEGLSGREVAALVSGKISSISKDEFELLAKKKEGYLFPETYKFPNNIDANGIIQKMESEFADNIKSVDADIKKFGQPVKDIIIMASLLEEEGKTTESRQIISGILWKRLELGIPLQVDAAFQYVNGKNTYELTTEDLKIDSPYNTYKYAGLPPAPISNPGLDSIKAVITPIESAYLYYLSERNGTLHYAKTYAEHLRNKALYIKVQP